MPIDASKTAMQVEGADGLKNLWGLAATEGPGALYQGAVAQAAATAVGHFRKLHHLYMETVCRCCQSSHTNFASLVFNLQLSW